MKWKVSKSRWYHKKPDFKILTVVGLFHLVGLITVSSEFIDPIVAYVIIFGFLIGITLPINRKTKLILGLTIGFSFPIIIYYQIWKYFNKKEEKKYKKLMKNCTKTDDFFYDYNVADFTIDN
jgi:hypothetical protein